MYDPIFILLALLFVKHWYIDFVNQTNEEVQWKGTYLDWRGVKHSVKHGLATIAILFAVTSLNSVDVISFGILDFVLHYHIDWAKININRKKNYTIEMPQFWAWLGADQLAHSLTYLFIVWAIL